MTSSRLTEWDSPRRKSLLRSTSRIPGSGWNRLNQVVPTELALLQGQRQAVQPAEGAGEEPVDVAGDGLEEERLARALDALHVDLVDVRELVAGRVHLEVVGVALQGEDRVLVGVGRHPGRQVRPVDRQALLLPLLVHHVGPGLEAARLDLLLDLAHVGVGGVELLQVVRGQVGRGPQEGHLLDERAARPVEGDLNRVVVDLANLARLLGAVHEGDAAGEHVRVEGHVVPVEQPVVGGVRRAVAPADALAQVEGPGARVVARLPAGQRVGHDLCEVRGQHRRELVQEPVVRPAAAAVGEEVHRAAVAAYLLGRHDHDRFGRDALGQRRQVTGVDHRLSHRRLRQSQRPGLRLPGAQLVDLCEAVGGCRERRQKQRDRRDE